MGLTMKGGYSMPHYAVRRLCEELLEGGEEVEVAAVLAGLAEVAEIVFEHEVEKAKEDVALELDAILGGP